MSVLSLNFALYKSIVIFIGWCIWYHFFKSQLYELLHFVVLELKLACFRCFVELFYVLSVLNTFADHRDQNLHLVLKELIKYLARSLHAFVVFSCIFCVLCFYLQSCLWLCKFNVEMIQSLCVCVCVCLSVCLSLTSNSLETIEVIIKLGTVTASGMKMHQVLIILTLNFIIFIFKITNVRLFHNFKQSKTKFAVKIVRLKVYIIFFSAQWPCSSLKVNSVKLDKC